ncbi:Protein PHOX3 [Labeo rohita]|uniref:Protein PHOX3 n=1 Tax=Labeo rohita TaxID=84645 RepID=A0ABQ8MQS0_LABRO|nr:Protein PHOX3 [Labeo rohita]
MPEGKINFSLKECMDYALLLSGSSYTVGLADEEPRKPALPVKPKPAPPCLSSLNLLTSFLSNQSLFTPCLSSLNLLTPCLFMPCLSSLNLLMSCLPSQGLLTPCLPSQSLLTSCQPLEYFHKMASSPVSRMSPWPRWPPHLSAQPRWPPHLITWPRWLSRLNSQPRCLPRLIPIDGELGPGLTSLIASVMDPPLMLVRAAGILLASILSSLRASTHSSLAGIPMSTVLPVMAVAILSVWAAHCTPEVSPVHESAPEASAVLESTQEPVKVLESTLVPPEVAASAAEPPEVVASTREFCLVMAKKAIHEISACPVTAKEAVHELSACPVMANDTDSELSTCPVQVHHCSMVHCLAYCFKVNVMILILFPCMGLAHHPSPCSVSIPPSSFTWFPCPRVIVLLAPLFYVSCSDLLKRIMPKLTERQCEVSAGNLFGREFTLVSDHQLLTYLQPTERNPCHSSYSYAMLGNVFGFLKSIFEALSGRKSAVAILESKVGHFNIGSLWD